MSDAFPSFELKPEVKEALGNLGKWMSQSVQLPNMDFIKPSFDYDAIYSAMQNNIADMQVEPIIPEGYFEKTQEYQQKSLEMLQAINQNTANLYTIVDLINKNNEKQDVLIELVTEILAIAKAKEKKEAETLFKKVMSRINDSVEDVDSIIKITGWAMTVYNMVLPMLQK